MQKIHQFWIHTVRSFRFAGIVLQFGSILSNCRNFPTIWSNPHLSNCRNFPTILVHSTSFKCRNFPTIWSNSYNIFTIFKSYNLLTIWSNHSNFPAYIFQIVGIFLQFSSILIFQIVGIFLQFGPIHIINTLFPNRIIVLQFGLIIAIFLHTSFKL